MKKRFTTAVTVVAKSTKFIKVIKVIKLLKPFLSAITMLLSMMAYSFAYGIIVGVGLTLLIFLHELGHVIALHHQGHKLRLPVFIPFVGAVIFSPRFDNRDKEAYVGIGGPLLGTVTSFLPLIIYFLTSNPIYVHLAYIGIFLNLFNMIPISPLDGGRITQAVSKHFKWLGFALLLFITLASKDAGMMLLWIVVTMDSNMSRYNKTIWAVVLFTIMLVAGFGLGFRHNIPTLWVDVGVAGFFTLLQVIGFIVLRNRHDAADDRPEDERPILTKQQRWVWFMRYAILMGLQITAMVILHPYLQIK
jgi:Zn-dependent protease